MFYGKDKFDPVLIVAQIAAVQALFYISLSLIYEVMLASYGLPSLSFSTLTSCFMWDYRYVTVRNSLGMTILVSNLVNSVCGAFFLAWLVERAKKCLDFGSTIYVVHLLVCTGVAGFPKSASWWVVNVMCLVMTTLLGEWLCMQKEMADIPTTATRNPRATRAVTRTDSEDLEAGEPLSPTDPGPGSIELLPVSRPAVAVSENGRFAGRGSVGGAVLQQR